jgi:hypothetical protein
MATSSDSAVHIDEVWDEGDFFTPESDSVCSETSSVVEGIGPLPGSDFIASEPSLSGGDTEDFEDVRLRSKRQALSTSDLKKLSGADSSASGTSSLASSPVKPWAFGVKPSSLPSSSPPASARTSIAHDSTTTLDRTNSSSKSTFLSARRRERTWSNDVDIMPIRPLSPNLGSFFGPPTARNAGADSASTQHDGLPFDTAKREVSSVSLPFERAGQFVLRVRLPDGRVAIRQFDASQRVDDVIRLFTYTYDKTASPTNFRLCMFDKSSTRPCWFVDGRHVLDSVDLFANRNRLNYVSLSLMRVERLANAWTCMNVTRALDDCSTWLVDTSEICAFFGREPRSTAAVPADGSIANQQRHASSDSGALPPLPPQQQQHVLADTQSVHLATEASTISAPDASSSPPSSTHSASTAATSSLNQQDLVALAAVSFAGVGDRRRISTESSSTSKVTPIF